MAAVVATGMHHRSGAVYVYERDAAGDWEGGDMLVSAPDALRALVGEERRCTYGHVGPFDCNDVELLAFVPNSILRAGPNARGVRTNDNWGWTDPETGREYALVGRERRHLVHRHHGPCEPRAHRRPAEARRHAALTAVARHQDLQGTTPSLWPTAPAPTACRSST